MNMSSIDDSSYMSSIVDIMVVSSILDITEVRFVEIHSAYGLGQAIRVARLRHELSQQQLAEQAGLTRQWLVELEQGKTNPTWDLVLRLTAALGLLVMIQPIEEKNGSAIGSAIGVKKLGTDLDDLLAAHQDSSE
jgi:DNA-binding XRE family transcriptional regulator